MEIPEVSLLALYTLRRLGLAAIVLLAAGAAVLGAHLVCREPARSLAPVVTETCGEPAR